METGYIAVAVLCFLYYGCLSWHAKRINSTFSMFWLFLGGMNIVLGISMGNANEWTRNIVLAASLIGIVIFVAVQIIILSSMVCLTQEGLDYIVILGAQIRGKKISNILKRRLDRGLKYLQENPETICIVSGGKGIGEDIPEAEAMSEYLLLCGIAEDRILLEEKSKTTWENLEKTKHVVKKIEKAKVGIVTNNFHIYRSVKIARVLGYKKVYALPATTNMIVFPNYMTREFFAVIKMYLQIKRVNRV